MMLSRRRFLRTTFVGGLVAAGLGGGAAILNFLYPRNADRRIKTMTIAARDVPPPGGEPLLNEEFGFLLVNLSEEDVRSRGLGVASPGLLALSTICPHLRRRDCPVQWYGDFTFPNPLNGGETERGWMRCPCHGSTFTPAGFRVFGPAPYSLDTLRIRKRNGRLYVYVTEITESGIDAGIEPLPWP